MLLRTGSIGWTDLGCKRWKRRHREDSAGWGSSGREYKGWGRWCSEIIILLLDQRQSSIDRQWYMSKCGGRCSAVPMAASFVRYGSDGTYVTLPVGYIDQIKDTSIGYSLWDRGLWDRHSRSYIGIAFSRIWIYNLLLTRYNALLDWVTKAERPRPCMVPITA